MYIVCWASHSAIMLLVLFKSFSKKFNTQPGKAYQGENEVEEIINLDWLRLGLSTSANIQRIGEKKIYYTHKPMYQAFLLKLFEANNQLVKLEAARSAYFWLPLVTLLGVTRP